MNLSDLKPSELILWALADLRGCEQDPKYQIQMSEWHRPRFFNYDTEVENCAVCLAGAVMAKTFCMPVDQRISSPEADELFNWEVLEAIDRFRGGRVHDGLRYLGIGPNVGGIKAQRHITPYDVDSYQFVADMNELAYDLFAAGY